MFLKLEFPDLCYIHVKSKDMSVTNQITKELQVWSQTCFSDRLKSSDLQKEKQNLILSSNSMF